LEFLSPFGLLEYGMTTTAYIVQSVTVSYGTINLKSTDSKL